LLMLFTKEATWSFNTDELDDDFTGQEVKEG
jgi:hypothetical protein